MMANLSIAKKTGTTYILQNGNLYYYKNTTPYFLNSSIVVFSVIFGI